jgi:hypothetical protein
MQIGRPWLACIKKIVFNQSAYCWHATKLVLALTAEKGGILPLPNNIFFASRSAAAFLPCGNILTTPLFSHKITVGQQAI